MPGFYTDERLSGHMVKRLAQLASPSGKHQHGTPMTAVKFRGLVDDGPEKTETYGYHGFTRTFHDPCCVLTDKGRNYLAKARAAGW